MTTRSLTDAERRTLDRRKAGFDDFFNESMPVLVDFIGWLQLPDAWRVVNEPDRFLSAVGERLDNQIVKDDDHDWVTARLGYLIGYVLTQRLTGHWLVVEDPDSSFFARYVVGGFSGCKSARAVADPIAIAVEYLGQPPQRNLVNAIDEIEEELRRA